MKTFKVTSKSQNVYQIKRSDKHTPIEYLVNADSDEMAAEICKALADDVQAAIKKYDILVGIA